MQTIHEFVAWVKVFFQENVIDTVKTITVKDVIDILLLGIILYFIYYCWNCTCYYNIAQFYQRRIYRRESRLYGG